VFYEDSRYPIHLHGFVETAFADDLNCYRDFSLDVTDAEVWGVMELCQESLHAWGCANQVCFDPSKESFHILHDKRPLGNTFPLLGVTFDARLIMDSAVYELAAIGHARVTAVLRLRRFHAAPRLVGFYKAQVLGKIEFATPAVFHATSFVLSALDRVQQRFLEALDISAETALFELRLAPLTTRRDIAMLGLIHRIVVGKAPSQFFSVVRLASRPSFPRSFRDPGRRHNKQLHDPTCGSERGLLKRSWLRLVYTYNLLPQRIVDLSSVSRFQGALQGAVGKAMRSDLPGWESILRNGVRQLTVIEFQSMFDG
jgi:hypothetical protein